MENQTTAFNNKPLTREGVNKLSPCATCKRSSMCRFYENMQNLAEQINGMATDIFNTSKFNTGSVIAHAELKCSFYERESLYESQSKAIK